MTKQADDRARLLADVLNDDWPGGPSADYALAAASLVRRRRARRRIVASAFAGVAVAAVVLLPSVTHQRSTSASPIRPTPNAAHRGYEIISDAELLDQLGDRPLIMIERSHGRRELTLLER